MRYDYSFQVWPDESKWSSECALWQLFKCYSHRVCLDFTEEEFTDFRVKLMALGYVLREVERVPYHEPESVL